MVIARSKSCLRFARDTVAEGLRLFDKQKLVRVQKCMTQVGEGGFSVGIGRSMNALASAVAVRVGDDLLLSRDKLHGGLNFLLRRGPTERDLPGPTDASCRIGGTRFALGAARKLSGRIHDQITVEHHQRLWSDRGFGSATTSLMHVRKVERGHQWVWQIALRVDVDRAANSFGWISHFPASGTAEVRRQLGTNSRTVHRIVEFS